MVEQVGDCFYFITMCVQIVKMLHKYDAFLCEWFVHFHDNLYLCRRNEQSVCKYPYAEMQRSARKERFLCNFQHVLFGSLQYFITHTPQAHRRLGIHFYIHTYARVKRGVTTIYKEIRKSFFARFCMPFCLLTKGKIRMNFVCRIACNIKELWDLQRQTYYKIFI